MDFVAALDMPLSAGALSSFAGPVETVGSDLSRDDFSTDSPALLLVSRSAFGGMPRPADWVGGAAATGCSERVGGHSGARRCGSGSYGLRS